MNNWKPRYDEYYWYIDNVGHLHYSNWYGFLIDTYRFEIGNVFKKKEEAKYELERRKVIKELKQFSDDFKLDMCNYFITYDYLNEHIIILCDNIYKHSDSYFESEDKAWKAVETVGRDRVVKYYLGIEEK